MTCVHPSTVTQTSAASILPLCVSLTVRVIQTRVILQLDVLKQQFHVMIMMHAHLMDVIVLMDAGTILLTVMIIMLALMTHVTQLQVVAIACMSALFRTNVILSPVTSLLAVFKQY